jgi:hypothetical protein
VLNTNPIALVDYDGADGKGKKHMIILQIDKKIENRTMTSESSKWEPPPLGWLKAHVDGSYIPKSGTATTGVVIRNHTGKNIIAAGNILQSHSSDVEAEAVALFHGAGVARQWSGSLIIFESDCLPAVHAGNREMQNLSHLRNTYAAFINSASFLSKWKYVFVKRANNNAAHECASYVRLLALGVWWYLE